MDEFLAFLDKYEVASSKTESEFTALLGKIEALKGEIEESSKSDSKFKVVLEKIESLNEETEASSKVDSESTTLLEMIGTSSETDSEYSALLKRMKALEERRSKRMNAARPALVQVEHQAEAGGSCQMEITCLPLVSGFPVYSLGSPTFSSSIDPASTHPTVSCNR